MFLIRSFYHNMPKKLHCFFQVTVGTFCATGTVVSKFCSNFSFYTGKRYFKKNLKKIYIILFKKKLLFSSECLIT